MQVVLTSPHLKSITENTGTGRLLPLFAAFLFSNNVLAACMWLYVPWQVIQAMQM